MPTLVTSTVDTGGTGDYVSLNAADAAYFGATGTDYVSNDEYVVCSCICTTGLADTAVVGITGYTTDSDHSLTLMVPVDYRHRGIIPAGGNIYRLVVSGGAHAIYASAIESLTLNGFAIQHTPSANGVVVLAMFEVTDLTIINTVAGFTTGLGTTGNHVCFCNVINGTNYIVNNIYFRATGKNINIVGNGTGTVYLYHNTSVEGGTHGIHRDDVCVCDVIAKNNLCFDSTYDYAGTFAAGTVNNVYSNHSDPGSDGLDASGFSAADIFQDADEANYLLIEDPIIGQSGINLYNDTVYPVLDDILRSPRPPDVSTWYAGAHSAYVRDPSVRQDVSDRISWWSLGALTVCGGYHPTS